MVSKGLMGGSRGEDQFEILKGSFPQFEKMTTEDVKELWYDVRFSIRFQRLTSVGDEDDEHTYFEKTPIYEEQYLKDKSLQGVQDEYHSYLEDALKAGLINDKLCKEALEAEELLDLIHHMNLIGYMASERVFQHLDYSRSEIIKRETIFMADLVGIRVVERIDAWGTRVDGVLLQPSDKKCVEALEWLLRTNHYFKNNLKYLIPSTAQINVRSGSFPKGSKVDRKNLIREIDDSTWGVESKPYWNGDYNHLLEHEPPVISLYSKCVYLGHDTKFEYQGYSEVEKVGVWKIHMQCIEANATLRDYPDWFNRVQEAKGLLSAKEFLDWSKRLKKFNQLKKARDYWDDILHNIAHEPWRDEVDAERGIEENFHYLSSLMGIPELIGHWVDDGLYEELTELGLSGSKAIEEREETEKEQLSLAEEQLSLAELPDEKSVPYSVESPNKEDETKPNLDLEKVEFVAECLREHDNDGTGINLKETLLFLDCCENHETEKVDKYKKNQISGKYEKISVPKRVPLVAKNFISSVINREHPTARAKPPPAHPVYQSYVLQFKNIVERESNGVKYYARDTAQSMDNITAWDMAEWLVTNLPRKTSVRIDIIKEERDCREKYLEAEALKAKDIQ